jgi:hypothetical protein
MNRVIGTTVHGSGMAVVLLLLAGTLFADSISFTYSGMGSGTVGQTKFSDAAFTIHAIGNTADIVTFPGNIFALDLSKVTISIAGVDKFTIITPTEFDVFPTTGGGAVQFGRAGPGGTALIIGPGDPQFATWNMRTSIGPITGQGDILQWSLPPPVSTSGGTLIFVDRGTQLTFKAVVPEPSSVWFLGFGLASICGSWLLRKFQST